MCFFQKVVLKQEDMYVIIYLIFELNRGLVKWYNRSLQNFCWEFDLNLLAFVKIIVIIVGTVGGKMLNL